MFERFTNRARDAVSGAADEARALGGETVGAEHLLLAMLADAGSIATKVLRGHGIERSAVLREVTTASTRDADALRGIGIDLEEVRRRAEAAFGPGALDRPQARRAGRSGRRRSVGGRLPFGDSARAVLEASLRAAEDLGVGYIGTEHLLLGIVADERSAATIILRRLGMGLDRTRLQARILEELGRAA